MVQKNVRVLSEDHLRFLLTTRVGDFISEVCRRHRAQAVRLCNQQRGTVSLLTRYLVNYHPGHILVRKIKPDLLKKETDSDCRAFNKTTGLDTSKMFMSGNSWWSSGQDSKSFHCWGQVWSWLGK